MRKFIKSIVVAGVAGSLLCACSSLKNEQAAQATAKAPASSDSTVYAVTLSTGFAVTGSKNTISSLFYQKPDAGTEWNYLGRPNNRIFNLAFFAPDKGKTIALATHTGVQQSFDYGKTWKVTTSWRMTEVNNVAFDPTNKDIMYATSPYGFYKSIDGGKHWTMKNNGLTTPDQTYVSSLVIDSTDHNRILISTEDGVYESKDSGENWTIIPNLTIKNIRVIVQNPHNPKEFVIGTENNGLYFSEDGGKIWAKRDTGVLHNTFYTIAFDPNNPDVIYAAGFQTGVYKSINKGKVWKHYWNGLTCLDIHGLAVDPDNSDIVYAATLGGGVCISTDAGLNWKFEGIDKGQVSAIEIVKF